MGFGGDVEKKEIRLPRRHGRGGMGIDEAWKRKIYGFRGGMEEEEKWFSASVWRRKRGGF